MTAVPRQVSCSWKLPFLVWEQEKRAVHTLPFSYHHSLHVLVKLHMPSHITHTHTSRKFHIHSWHCCPQKSCFHSNKSLLLQVPYLWAPSHKLCSSQSEQTEQRTDPVINHTSFDLASYHLSVVLHVAITITWPSHDYHMTIIWLSITITWLSHDCHMTVHNYHMTITWLSSDHYVYVCINRVYTVYVCLHNTSVCLPYMLVDSLKMVEKETDCGYTHTNIESGASNTRSHFSCLHGLM